MIVVVAGAEVKAPDKLGFNCRARCNIPLLVLYTMLLELESRSRTGRGLLAPFFPCLIEFLVVLQAHVVPLWRLRH